MKRLVVIVPGLGQDLSRGQEMLARLKKEPELQDTHWLECRHECRWWSPRLAMAGSRHVRARIEQKVQADGPYDDIILVGHSIGGVLVRQAYLLAAGIYDDERTDVPWHDRVSRIVLLASLNRGINPKNSIRLRLGRIITSLLPWPTLFGDIVRGSAFITELRLQWISYFRRDDAPRPTIVQLLGDRDKEVCRDDSIDLQQFPRAKQVIVPDVDHFSLIDINATSNKEEHYKQIRWALIEAAPDEALVASAEKKDIIFVLHGIRAYGTGWVSKMAAALREAMPDAHVITPEYGYFSALQFAIPWLHHKPVRWFQDMYSQELAAHGNPQFHFVGHSNATYAFARSLDRLRAIRFERAYLAGCVLPREFQWDDKLSRGQVKLVRNDCANRDVPVGWLCSLLGGWGRGVGTAGVHGFTTGGTKVLNHRYINGDHGTALNDDAVRASIVTYIKDGVSPEPTLTDKLPPAYNLLSRFLGLGPVTLIAVVAILWFLGSWLGAWNLLAGLLILVVLLLFV